MKYTRENIYGVLFIAATEHGGTLYRIEKGSSGHVLVTWNGGRSTSYRIESVINYLNNGDWIPQEVVYEIY